MRRSALLATVVSMGLAVAGCSQSTAGRPEAGAPATSTTVAGAPVRSSAVTDRPDPRTDAGTVVDAATVEQRVLRPMQTESDDFWEEILGLAGSPATVSAPMNFLSGSDTVDCGGTQLSGQDQYGPTYCAAEDTIVVSQTYLNTLGESRALRTDGSFADPAVEVGTYFLLAHQWGHNIIGELVAVKGADLTSVPSTQIELAADCLAGLMIAGVPRVFTDKDTASILGQVPLVGERFAGIQAPPQARAAAVSQGLGIDYDQRQQFAAGIDQCLTAQAPQLAAALA